MNTDFEIGALSPHLKTPQAAKYMGISYSLLTKLRSAGGGPIFQRIGTAVTYRQEDLDRWLETRRYRSTSEIAVD